MYNIVAPDIKFPGIYSYPWVERGTVKVKCLRPREPCKLANKINHLTH